MREIKFRAYSKSYEKTFDNEMLERAADVMCKAGKSLLLTMREHEAANDLQRGIYLPTYDEDLILMQYTGLKDKNGKEIYEGDILSYKKIIYTNCSMEEIEEIKDEVLIELINYRPIASIVKPLSKGVECFGYDNVNNECLILDLQSEELEVIGNIYENSELLK